MAYLENFQNIALFENTFKHQINKKTGKVEERGFVFNRHFGKKEGELPVEKNRYRLIWMPGCPHSNKAVITLRLLGLDKFISVGECGILRDPRGWVFSEDLGGVDPVLKIHYLDDAYLKGDPDFVGRSTVPAIADVTTGAIVQNEAWDIPKYLILDWKKLHKENAPDLYPEALRTEIDERSAFINSRINAYQSGFARNQESYEHGYTSYFEAMDELEALLADKRFIHGDYITLSDIHLYVALIRFHVIYHLVFGVNKKRLEDYPNLWGYTREIYQTEGFYDYTKLELIKRHYQQSPHMRAKLGNVYGLIGTGPDNRALLAPAGREQLSQNPSDKFIFEKDGTRSYDHQSEAGEIDYLQEELLFPIEKAGQAEIQTDLERWAHIEADTLHALDQRLSSTRYLLGDTLTKADIVLYQTLLRHDHIYYYLYKLNFAKSFDYRNIKRFTADLQNIPEASGSIDIIREKEEAYRNLEDDRNPYHLIFSGPEI